MNRAAIAQDNKSENFSPHSSGILQRKCAACSSKTTAEDECTECANKKGKLQRKLSIGANNDPLEHEADRVADQVMSMSPGSNVTKTAPSIQRASIPSVNSGTTTPASVDRVLASSGRPLESSIKQGMEQRFGHNFSQVRLHTNHSAEQSALDVNAHAYTVGNNIVFGAGRFTPHTRNGQRLLAHELAHVVQQSSVLTNSSMQRQGQPRPRPAAINTKAQAIVDFAKDKNRTNSVRAEGVVRRIINEYFTEFTSMVDDIKYDEALKSGLDVTSVGRGSNAKGKIRVSLQFLNGTTQRHFARRVLQVRHELRHIEQYRSGMTGDARQNEREFIAFYHEATSPELVGTGRIQHATRVSLIDGALGYYYCLSARIKDDNSNKREALLARRVTEVSASNRSDIGAAPTSCQH